MEGTDKAPVVIKVSAICGSLRKGSINRGLIRAAIKITEESIKGVIMEDMDISLLPYYNQDLEVDGTYAPEVEAFRKKIHQAERPLKNAIDWASRPPNVWADKASALVSAAGGSGGNRQQQHLRQIGVFLDLHFINKPEFYLRRPAAQAPPKVDRDGNLIDIETKDKLKNVLLSLYAFTLRLQGKCK